MLTTSAAYQAMLRDPNHRKEIKLIIDGKPYMRGYQNLHTASIRRELLSAALPVGNACASQLNALLIPSGTIPKMARVDTFVALAVDDAYSEWIPAGTFFIDTRERDGTFMRISCYDSMLKAEAQFFTSGAWLDISMLEAAEEIAKRIDCPLDPRTEINIGYSVRYPNDYTIREVLCYIAAAHGGNWIITAENKLRLVPFGQVPPETDYIVTEYGDALVLGRTRLRWR